jgi:hypothetical protein
MLSTRSVVRISACSGGMFCHASRPTARSVASRTSSSPKASVWAKAAAKSGSKRLAS